MTAEEVLREFVDDIETAGGLKFVDNCWVPAGEPSWSNLAFTYLKACEVLGREPVKEQEVCIDCGGPVDPEVMTCDACFEKDQAPEDEDLVTSNYVTFHRFGMGKPAFVVLRGETWREAANRYMKRTQYWPRIWAEEERGGYTNITEEKT